MRFSVLIPVYNVEGSLRNCIESVLNQTFSDFEIVMVDDGSTDESGKICDEYSGKYNYITTLHKQNDGLYMARVDAMKVASGEYFLFLDSDDTIEVNTLEEIDKILKSDPRIDMVIFREKLTYVSTGISWESPVLYGNGYVSLDDIAERLSRTADLNNLVMKCVKAPQKIDFEIFHHFNMAEDVAFTCQFLEKCQKYYYTDKVFYNYLLNESSITHKVTSSNLVNAAIARSEMYVLFQRKKILNQFKRPLINEYVKNVAYFISELDNEQLKSQTFLEDMEKVKSKSIWEYSKQNINQCNISNKIFMFFLNKEKYRFVRVLGLAGRRVRKFLK